MAEVKIEEYGAQSSRTESSMEYLVSLRLRGGGCLTKSTETISFVPLKKVGEDLWIWRNGLLWKWNAWWARLRTYSCVFSWPWRPVAASMTPFETISMPSIFEGNVATEMWMIDGTFWTSNISIYGYWNNIWIDFILSWKDGNQWSHCRNMALYYRSLPQTHNTTQSMKVTTSRMKHGHISLHCLVSTALVQTSQRIHVTFHVRLIPALVFVVLGLYWVFKDSFWWKR